MEFITAIIVACLYTFPTNIDNVQGKCQMQLLECASENSYFNEDGFKECARKAGENKPKLPIPYVNN